MSLLIQKIKLFSGSALKIFWIILSSTLVMAIAANYFIRSTTPEGFSEGIVFTYVKDTFFKNPPFFDQLENDSEFIESQKIYPGLSAVFRVEKANIPEICSHGKGLQPIDHWKIPNGFYLCTYGPQIAEIPYPEATGFMMTILKGYRTTRDFWIISEDFTNGIPKTVKAFNEDNSSIVAEATIVYRRKDS